MAISPQKLADKLKHQTGQILCSVETLIDRLNKINPETEISHRAMPYDTIDATRDITEQITLLQMRAKILQAAANDARRELEKTNELLRKFKYDAGLDYPSKYKSKKKTKVLQTP